MQKSLLLLVFLLFNLSLQATEPPTQKQTEKYKKDGTLRQKAERAKAYGNLKIAPNLVNNLKYRAELKLSSSTSSSDKKADLVLGNFTSLGTPKMLVLLVEFPEYLHKAINNREQVATKIFGQGDNALFPYDSLTQFYKRSSYNKLDIQGNVLDWYQSPFPRPADTGDNAWQVKQQIVRAAIEHHDALGHDFSQYDNNGDGTIDYIAVIWTGPIGEWASLWWGTYSAYDDDSFVVDGKTMKGLSWQQISYDVNEGPFTPQTLIHETGHAMGLPDYYDYAPDIGPNGGVGRLDIMDGEHDHNAFSKYLLGWLTPQVVGSGSEAINLLPSISAGDALLIMPLADETTKYDEFFIVESRKQAGNDIDLPNSGVLIWHVDTTLSAWGWFKNDNSYSDDKFLRLVQADGLDEIENLSKVADAADFYATGGEFSPDTNPQSRNNAHEHTGVRIVDMTVAETVSFTGEIIPSVPNFSFSHLDEYQVLRSGETSSVTALAETEIDKVDIYIDNTLTTTLQTAPFDIVWTDDTIFQGSHQIAIKVTNLDGYSSTERRNVIYLNGEKSVLIVSLGIRDIDNGAELKSILSTTGMPVVTSHFVFPFEVEDFDFVLVDYGSANGPWEAIDGSEDRTVTEIARAATSTEVAAFSHYIEQGGSIIIQGEGVFNRSAQDPTLGLSVLFGVTVARVGLNVSKFFADDVYQQRPIDVSFANSEEYVQADLFIANDAINNSHNILTASGLYYDGDASQWLQTQGTCSLNHQVLSAKVIVSSCLLRRLDTYSKGVLLNNYLSFFGVSERIAINRKPVISAGSDQTITEGRTVTLSGSAQDADNDNLTVTWSQSSGTTVTLSTINSLTPTFIAPQVSSNQTVMFELSISDGAETVTDTVSVTIRDSAVTPPISGSPSNSSGGGSTTYYHVVMLLLLLFSRQTQSCKVLMRSGKRLPKNVCLTSKKLIKLSRESQTVAL